MPFNAAPISKTAAEEDLSYATGREGLRRLAILLRQPHEDFAFYFGFLYDKPSRNPLKRVARALLGVRTCGAAGCALGLAYHCWPQFRAQVDCGIKSQAFAYAAYNTFSINYTTADNLFYPNLADRLGKRMSAITPEDVAAAIDEYLHEVSWR